MAKRKSTIQDAIDSTRVVDDPTVRIHRLYVPGPGALPQPTGELFTGAIVDVETTGLDPKTDKIIELGILLFSYDTTDRIVLAIDGYTGLQDPGHPLSPEITELTGLTDADLKGQSIDWGKVKALVEPARIFVAHKAEFDRPFIEKAADGVGIDRFTKRPWACSYKEVNWKKCFPETTANSLGAILAGTRREYYEAHRALDDCWATLRVLSTPIDVGGAVLAEAQAFTDLLASARTDTRRIWADDAPFNLKDTLKLRRHYQWQPEQKTWYLDVKTSEAVVAEIAWLREHGVQARVTYFGAKDRWSARV